MARLPLSAFVISIALLAPASAAIVTRTVHDQGEDFTVTCNSGPVVGDYVANTDSGVAPGSAYARERGAYKGTVRLMSEGGKRVKRYVLGEGSIRAMVRVRIGVADWADLLFTPGAVVLVHTATADAGIFTDSDIWRLAEDPAQGVDGKAVKDADTAQMLGIGLKAYNAATGQCTAHPG